MAVFVLAGVEGRCSDRNPISGRSSHKWGDPKTVFRSGRSLPSRSLLMQKSDFCINEMGNHNAINYREVDGFTDAGISLEHVVRHVPAALRYLHD